MAGLGVLFAGLSGAGRALASSAQEAQRVNDESRLMQERARLEEEKALRIDEARRKAERQAGVQMGADISTATTDLQNQRDAEAINAANGSQMTAADAAVLRNNPEARKAYGLLGSSRQTDLEDRATAAEKLGYLDAAKESRGQLQTEFVNQRALRQDENADADRKDEKEWRKQEADRRDRREAADAAHRSALLAYQKARDSKQDTRAEQAAASEARLATGKALDNITGQIKDLRKEATDAMTDPKRKEEAMQEIADLTTQATAYRDALAKAGLEVPKATGEVSLNDFRGGGGKPASPGTVQHVPNDMGGGPVPARLSAEAQRRLAAGEASTAKPSAEADRAALAARAKQQAAEFSSKSAGGNRMQQLRAEEARANLASLERKYQEAVARRDRGKDAGGPPGLKLRAEAEVNAAKAALDEAKAAAR